MAGVYGSINSHADFLKRLDEAEQASLHFLSKKPADETMEAIYMQLHSMRNWTANGRTPSPVERESLDMSTRAAREYEPIDDKDLYELVQKVYELQSFFEDWPSDAQAASATDDDWFDSDD